MTDASKLIPIYDDTVAVTCSISDAEIPVRVELFDRMRNAMISLDRTATGLRLRFADTPDVRADLAAFVIDEKRCCQFWGFEVLHEPDTVVLRWDGPPAADDLLDQLQTYFTTDAPISLIRGLL